MFNIRQIELIAQKIHKNLTQTKPDELYNASMEIHVHVYEKQRKKISSYKERDKNQTKRFRLTLPIPLTQSLNGHA